MVTNTKKTTQRIIEENITRTRDNNKMNNNEMNNNEMNNNEMNNNEMNNNEMNNNEMNNNEMNNNEMNNNEMNNTPNNSWQLNIIRWHIKMEKERDDPKVTSITEEYLSPGCSMSTKGSHCVSSKKISYEKENIFGDISKIIRKRGCDRCGCINCEC